MTDLIQVPTAAATPPSPRSGTGIAGLDYILGGGLPPHHLFLIEGAPGTGKTTLALQFLLAGSANGERTLYVTMAETARELQEVAASHGWDLSGIEVLELVPPDEVLRPEAQYTVFHPSEVELGQTFRSLYDAVQRLNPSRVVLDSLSEMRVVAADSIRLRRQILGLKQYFLGRDCSVFLLDDLRSEQSDAQFASIAHGVISLEHLALEYGAERRRLRVGKLRGQRFRGGFHDFAIRTGGLEVYPRLSAAEFPSPPEGAGNPLTSESAAIDALTGGGLDRGSTTLLVGPAGVGKSVLMTQYALAAAHRGEQVAAYLFDERLRTFLARARGLGMDVEAQIAAGRLHVQQLDPAELSPGQFAHLVMRAVEDGGVQLVLIDSLSGYMTAMPEERLLTIHLHELFSYLSQRGVTTLLTLAQQAPFSQGAGHSAEISYLADAIILLRYFEAAGEVRQAISMLKKRGSDHEHTIREYRIAPGGFQVGEPLSAFQGVLTGVPRYVGQQGPLLDQAGGGRRDG
jgi:circadian clock protein KaiC